MTKNQMVLDLAVSTGEVLLKNGAEIFRVQETVTRILEAFGICDHNVYVVSNGIFATVEETSAEPCHAVRHVPLGGVHMGRVAAVNQLSREISEGCYTPEQAREKLRACKEIPPANPLLQIAACGTGCACFCYLFGGSFLDSVAAFPLGLLLQCFLLFAGKHGVSRFMMIILGSGMVTIGGALMLAAGAPISFNQVIIGSIISLVPGVAFTTSIRDFFNGDYISGSIHMIDALLTAVCIAVGVGTVIQCVRLLSGGVLL